MPKIKQGAWMTYNDGTFNDLDLRILFHCSETNKNITELSKLIDVAPKNISERIAHLKKEKLILTDEKGDGKPTFVIPNTKHPRYKELIRIANFKNLFDERMKKLTPKEQAEVIKDLQDNSPKILGRQVVSHIDK